MAMKTIKAAEATKPQLNWLVARIEGDELPKAGGKGLDYSSDWAHGGPIKERERISTDWDSGTWNASSDKTPCYFSAQSELVAAMRAHVYSKLGVTVEVPEELT